MSSMDIDSSIPTNKLLTDELTLMEYLSRDRWSYLFLRLCFLSWPLSKENNGSWTDVIKKTIAAAGLIAMIVACLIIWFSSGALLDQSYGSVLFYFTLFELISTFFMEISSFVNIYYCRLRLILPPIEVDLPHYSSGAKISALFLLSYLLFSLVAAIFFIGPSSTLNILTLLLVLVQWIMTIGLALSLFFIIVDCRTCHSIIQDLTSLVDMQSLSMEKLIEAKAVIKQRVDYYPVVNGAIALIAVLNSLIFLLLILFLRIIVTENQFSNIQGDALNFAAGEAVSALAILSKEVVYLILILREIASVNTAADSLTKRLCCGCWTEDKELLRMRLFVNLYGEQISFPLCGHRPTKHVVFWQVSIYFASFSASLLHMLLSKDISQFVHQAG